MGTTGGDTWGISGPDFLFLYAFLGFLAVIAAGLYRAHLRGSADAAGYRPDVDVYDLALLNGGAALAITTAAAKLRQDGLLGPGSGRHTLMALGLPAAGADPLERDVLTAVQRRPGISARALRRALEHAATVAQRRAKLVASGLLIDSDRVSRARGLGTLFALVAALGIVRIAAGLDNGRPVGGLILMVIAASAAGLYLACRPPMATVGARVLIRERRESRPALRTSAAPADIPVAVALFGAGALWGSDPTFAAAWSVPRESSGSGFWGGGGDGGGGCGGGGGGCGGGGCGG